jgi:hypothetical protein
LGAIALVAGSVAVRARLDRNREAAHPLRLTCTVELEAVCGRIGHANGARVSVTVQAAGATADRLATATGDAGLDGWLVTSPWPRIVDGRRQVAGLPPLFAAAPPVVARSPLVLVVWKDRAAVLAKQCPTGVTWRCLGEAAAAGPWTASGGQPEWGPLKPGHADPSSDDVGLLVLGQAVAGWFGRADLSTTDLDDGASADAFAGWFTALERAVPPSATSPLSLMLTAGPAVYDAVGTTEAEAGTLLATSVRRSALDLLYPSPMATADVVLAAAATAASGAAPSLRRVATGDVTLGGLAAAGWRVPGRAAAQGIDASQQLPAGDGLPPAGLLDALRGRWREVTGR